MSDDRRNRIVAETWETLQDLAGRASLWPELIRRLFWTRRLGNWQRTVLCTFCFINGLSPELIIDWNERCVPIFRDKSASRHFLYVYGAIKAGRYPYLYAYNVSQNRYEHTDGKTRRYQNKEKRLEC